MEKPKPTQSLEQKQETPEDYVVATFPVDTDPESTNVIRSGQDGKGARRDGGLDCWRYAKCVIFDYCAGKMRSREYTVVLAISMMDGSFNVDKQDKTVTHYN